MKSLITIRDKPAKRWLQGTSPFQLLLHFETAQSYVLNKLTYVETPVVILRMKKKPKLNNHNGNSEYEYCLFST